MLLLPKMMLLLLKMMLLLGLERDNAELQNTIVGLREELEHTKAAKDKLQ